MCFPIREQGIKNWKNYVQDKKISKADSDLPCRMVEEL